MKKIIYRVLFLSIVFISILLNNTISETIPKSPNEIKPLLIGDNIPNAKLKNIEGKEVNIKDVVNGNTVLIFFRGGWCPYCNKHLSELTEIEKDIKNLGFRIIAISPDNVNNSIVNSEKNNLNYELYSDFNMELSKKMGIAYVVDKSYKEKLNKANISLSNFVIDGKEKSMLPVPSVFVFVKGKIEFEHVIPNYKKRISSKMLLSVLKSLK